MMKTKKILFILALLPLMAVMTACSSDDEPNAKPAKEILRVLEGGVVLPAKNSAVATDRVMASVSVQADCEWVVLDRYGNPFGSRSSYGFGTKLSVTPLKGVGNGNQRRHDVNSVMSLPMTILRSHGVGDGTLREIMCAAAGRGDCGTRRQI